jgi:hypothetical protein
MINRIPNEELRPVTIRKKVGYLPHILVTATNTADPSRQTADEHDNLGDKIRGRIIDFSA